MNFGDDRAPLEYTGSSSVQTVRVCPHCKRGNQFNKHWFAGNCRHCGKMFNRDQALSDDQQVGDIAFEVVRAEGSTRARIKGEMEERAHAYKNERAQMDRDGGERKRAYKSPLWKHYDGEKDRR